MTRFVFISILFSLSAFSQVNKEFYRTVPKFTNENNIAYQIKLSLENYQPLSSFNKNAKVDDDKLKTLFTASLANTKTALGQETIKTLMLWQKANHFIESYYGIYELNNCIITDYDKKQTSFNFEKFIDLQQDFLTYFQYSIIANLVSKEDIENETLHFIKFMNLLHEKCDLTLVQKQQIIDLYSDLFQRFLLPIQNSKRVSNEALKSFLEAVNFSTVTSFDSEISLSYSLVLKSIGPEKVKQNPVSLSEINNFYKTLNELGRKKFPKNKSNNLKKILKNLTQANFLKSEFEDLAYDQLRTSSHRFNLQVLNYQYSLFKKIYPQSKTFELFKVDKRKLLDPETNRPYEFLIEKNRIIFKNSDYSSKHENVSGI